MSTPSEEYLRQPMKAAGWMPTDMSGGTDRDVHNDADSNTHDDAHNGTHRRARDWPGAGRELLVGLAVLVAVTALGAPMGALWSALSPRVLVRMSDQGPVLTTGEPEEYMGSEVVFTLLGLGVGLTLGVLCWMILRRWRGPVVLVGLAIGSLLCACLALQVGRRIGLAEYEELKRTAMLGWEFYRPPTLETGEFIKVIGIPIFPRGSLTMQAFAAVFTYTMFAGWSRYRNLQTRDPEPQQEPEWNSEHEGSGV